MAKAFPLPAPYGRHGWKLKIRDRERVEPPHATILFRVNAWRFGLREGTFLDGEPDPRLVPRGIVDFLEANHRELVEAWDALYPHNKVWSEDA